MTQIFLRFLKQGASAVGFALWALTPAHAQDRLYTNAELLAEGNSAYQQADCPRATRFLFAYEQRNPSAMQVSEVHRHNVLQAIENCNEYGVGGTAGMRGKYDTGSTGGRLPSLDLHTGGGPIVNGRCDIYARIAISQHEANLVQGCGYKDNRWNVNYRYHYDWCIGTPSDTTRQETGARQAMLDRCKP